MMKQQPTKDVLISWLLHGMKTIIGYESVRKAYLDQHLHQVKFVKVRQQNVLCGEYTLDKAWDFIERGSGLEILTLVSPSKIEEEAHYIALLVDHDTKTVLVFDSLGPEQNHYFDFWYQSRRDWNVDTQYSTRLQTDPNDMFCQTWCLLMVVHYLTQGSTLQCHGAQFLLDRMKEIVSTCEWNENQEELKQIVYDNCRLKTDTHTLLQSLHMDDLEFDAGINSTNLC